MTGMTNYSADAYLNHLAGIASPPALATAFLALFTAVGTDAGSGFTEVSGNAYARVQIAGSVSATGSFTTGSPNISMATNPGWVVPGMNVYDSTNGFQIGTVLTYVGTALVLTGNAAHASSGSTDSLTFSLFPQASGTGPASTTNGGVATFPQATGAGWGTSIAWGIFDASTSGNLLFWDFLGSSAWAPFSASSVGSGNGGVLTQHAHGYSNGTPVVVSAEFGGTLPTVTQGTLTGSTINFAANVTTDTYTLSSSSSAPSSANAVWTSATGNAMARSVVQQPIAGNVTPSFAASTLTLSLA